MAAEAMSILQGALARDLGGVTAVGHSGLREESHACPLGSVQWLVTRASRNAADARGAWCDADGLYTVMYTVYVLATAGILRAMLCV